MIDDTRADAPTGEVIGWRAWHLTHDDDGPVLTSLNYPAVWRGPAFTADEVPTEQNSHGIYAKATHEAALLFTQLNSVWGTVALHGIVVVGTDGYRAEHAIIRSLHLNPPRLSQSDDPMDDEARVALAHALAVRYGMDVDIVPWLPADRLALVAMHAKEAKLAAAMTSMREAMRALAETIHRTSLVVAVDNAFGQNTMIVGSLERYEIDQRRAPGLTYAISAYFPPFAMQHTFRFDGQVLTMVEP
jgi:hypothetical protein